MNVTLSLAVVMVMCFGCKENAKKLEVAENTQKVKVEQEPEWKKLFNGVDFEGWKSIATGETPNKGWKVIDGELVVNEAGGGESENGGDIITKKKFADFELQWEWKMLTKGGNSGLKYYVNSTGENNEKYGLGIEYQILDDEFHPWMLEGKMKPGDYYTVGAAYNLYAPGVDKKVMPRGEWNKSRIISKNGKVEHWLNGELTVKFDRFSKDFDERVAKSKFHKYEGFGKHESGHILLQDHGGNVHYRNIMIKEFPKQ